VPSGHAGEAPEGMQVIHSPTGVFLIAGRIQVDGEDDLPAVNALQDRFTLTPLDVNGASSTRAPLAGVPQPDRRVGEELEWWERFRVALAAFPPPGGDAPFLSVCAKLGLASRDSPYVDLDPERAQMLIDGASCGSKRPRRSTPSGH
jgi:hypothetical protein